MSLPTPWTLASDWVFPVSGPPIRDGLITIQGGRILNVQARAGRHGDVELGARAVMPGLVNAHTHLDLGHSGASIPPTASFASWLRAVVSYRRSSSPADWSIAVRSGIEACIRSGTTLVGDISVGGLSLTLLASSPLRAVVFHELIGLTQTRADQTWHEAETWLGASADTESCRRGLSTHAPFSVRRSLFQRAARVVSSRRVPLSIHLAETPDELELLSYRTGPLREFLEEIGAWDGRELCSSIEEIIALQPEGAAMVYAHGNYLDQGQIRTLAARSGASVVYCPRTHARFQHPPHPFPEMRKQGLEVALGTDSLASNPDLSMLEELRFLRQLRVDTPAGELLYMATQAGANALDWGDHLGSLSPGKLADLVAVPVTGPSAGDPHDLWLRAGDPVTDVCIGGRWAVRNGSLVS